MSDQAETTFLQALLAEPDDDATRLLYADWLDEHHEQAKAAYMRLDAGRIDRVGPGYFRVWEADVVASDEHPPLVKQAFRRWLAEAPVREALDELQGEIDPEWWAYVNTVACPFRPFLFHGREPDVADFSPETLPLSETIGSRGQVLTFATSFNWGESWDARLAADLHFLLRLKELPHGKFGGGVSFPLHPFVIELPEIKGPLTSEHIVAALKPVHRPPPIIDGVAAASYALDRSGGSGVEIHTDAIRQKVFSTADEEVGFDSLDNLDPGPPSTLMASRRPTGPESLPPDDAQTTLRRYVEGQGEKLWYVTLSGGPTPKATPPHHYTLKFALGRSPNGRRLLGVVGHDLEFYDVRGDDMGFGATMTIDFD